MKKTAGLLLLGPFYYLGSRKVFGAGLIAAVGMLTVLTQIGTVVVYLDACFPFFNGFPMLPHLSHHDGQKADLAFMYQDARAGRPLSGPPSWFGYGAYEQPKAGEMQPCRGVSSPLRWDFDRLQPLFAFARMDPVRTKILVEALSRDPGVQKILLEPHLKARMDIRSDKVRFQGCRAARHDDHIHVQL
jgi:hypothetical protein